MPHPEIGDPPWGCKQPSRAVHSSCVGIKSVPDGLARHGLPHASRSSPSTGGAGPTTATVIILTAESAAPVPAPVVGVFDVPFVTNVQLAHQGPDHDFLRSEYAGSPGDPIVGSDGADGMVEVAGGLIRQTIDQLAGTQRRSRVSLSEDSICSFTSQRLLSLDSSSSSVGRGGMVTAIAAW